MPKALKIALTLPSLLGFSYLLIAWFPEEFHWLVPSMKAHYIQIASLQGLIILQLVVLIRKLWSFEGLAKSKKKEWTWLLILYGLVTAPIFIWKRIDEFAGLDGEIS